MLLRFDVYLTNVPFQISDEGFYLSSQLFDENCMQIKWQKIQIEGDLYLEELQIESDNKMKSGMLSI